MHQKTPSHVTLVVLAIGISAFFLFMIRAFIMPIILAAIFTGLTYPLYQRILRGFKGRQVPASLLTVLILLGGAILPIALFLGVVISQAISLSQTSVPRARDFLQNGKDRLAGVFGNVLGMDLSGLMQQAFDHAGGMVGAVSNFLVERLTSVTVGTFNTILLFLIMLYSMFFFYKDGAKFINAFMYYSPLENTHEKRLLNRFLSVTRATLKGSLVVGFVQGSLAGGAFYVLGITAWAFWGMVMMVLSIIPGIGSTLIWVPACFILLLAGHIGKAIALGLFCGLVVGTIDNVLRPRLVGKDTQMHDLLIFFSTLGGILVFGFFGFLIGPILAALCVSTWEIVGEVFGVYLDRSMVKEKPQKSTASK